MVHCYQMNGYNIIIDGNSGAIHSVDPVAFDVIQSLNQDGRFGSSHIEDKKRIDDDVWRKIEDDLIKRYGIDREEGRELRNEIQELMDEEKLFSEDPFFELAGDLKERQGVLKAICLHVAHDCNMDCEYCFAGKGQYRGKASLMDLATGKRALDFLVEHSEKRHNLEVDFFGGEPLLDWDVVKEIVAYGRTLEQKTDKKFRFTLTTNGLLLNDEIVDFLNREMGNVVISLDGRRAVNDAMRHTRSGVGTYDLVLDPFLRLAESRDQKDYYMRGTYTAANLDFASDILHMADLGFRELSMEPVVADPDESYALTMEHGERICAEYERLALEMIRRRREGRAFHFYHYTIDLTGGPCIGKRVSGCGVGTEYLAVTPEGDLYPCHQFVGDDAFRVGDLWSGISRPETLAPFGRCNVYSHEECRDCFARLYCSGGCAANAYHATGKIDGVYELGCILHRKRIECAIMMKVDEEEGRIG